MKIYLATLTLSFFNIIINYSLYVELAGVPLVLTLVFMCYLYLKMNVLTFSGLYLCDFVAFVISSAPTMLYLPLSYKILAVKSCPSSLIRF